MIDLQRELHPPYMAKDQAPKSMKIRVTDTFYTLPASAKNLVVPEGVDFVAQTVTLVDLP
jgi:hypothetical protein